MTFQPAKSLRLTLAAGVVVLATQFVMSSSVSATTLGSAQTAPTVTLGATAVTVAVSLDPQGADLTSGTLCYSTDPNDVVDAGSQAICAAGATQVPIPGVAGSTVQATAVTVGGLTPGTQYFYSLETTDSTNATSVFYDGSFTTYSEAVTAGSVAVHLKIGASLGSAVVTIGTIAAVPSSEVPTGLVDLSGLVPYVVSNLAPGSSVTMTFEVSGKIVPTTVLRDVAGTLSDITSTTSIAGHFITLTLTDGGTGDADATANGSIADSLVILGTIQPQATLTLKSAATTLALTARHAVLKSVGGSGNGTVTFHVDTAYVNSASCSVTGHGLTASTAGTCEVVAAKAAMPGFYATTSAPVLFTYELAKQKPLTITNSSLSRLLSRTTLLHTSGGSGKGNVSFAVDAAHVNSAACSVVGRVLSATTPGTCDVVATKASSSLYDATTSAAVEFTFNYALQRTLVISNSTQTRARTSVVVLHSAGGSGSGAVTFALDASSANSANCSITGTSLSATAAGTCEVVATKAASMGYGSTKSAGATFTFS